MQKNKNIHYRRESNCSDEEGIEVDGPGVETVEDLECEQITTPPDNLVAKEMQSIEVQKFKKASGTSSITASRVHIQDPKSKKLTPAAKLKQEMNLSLLNMMQREQERENPEEDEIDLSFASVATRMRIHLNRDQREDVIQEIEKVVTTAINNVRKGMPVLQTPPGIRVNPPPGYILPMTNPPPTNIQNPMVGAQVSIPQPPPLQGPTASQMMGPQQQENTQQSTSNGAMYADLTYSTTSYNYEMS